MNGEMTYSRLVSLNILLMYHKMQSVTQILPQPFVVLLSSLMALSLREHSICPLDVTTLNSSVCIRDDTDINQAFNIEVTTSM